MSAQDCSTTLSPPQNDVFDDIPRQDLVGNPMKPSGYMDTTFFYFLHWHDEEDEDVDAEPSGGGSRSSKKRSASY